MAFFTGEAHSFADLQAALFAACTAHGYTVKGNVIHKGALFCEVAVSAAAPAGLTVQGGTGQSLQGGLTGRSNGPLCYLGLPIATRDPITHDPDITWTVSFPVTWFIHLGTAPDEVTLLVNYQTTGYQYLAFGQSAMPGLSGTGNWYAASARATDNATQMFWGYQTTGRGGGSTYWSASLFDGSATYGNAAGAVHHGLDGAPDNWLHALSWPDRWPVQENTPSAWNAEAVLSPIVVYTVRPEAFISPVLSLGHARWVRLDHLADQQILTLGAERWKVYPVWRRGTVRTLTPRPEDGGTGFLGHAFRYDGP